MRKPVDSLIKRKSTFKSTGSSHWLEHLVLCVLKNESRSSQIIQQRLREQGIGAGVMVKPRLAAELLALLSSARGVAVPSETHCSGLPAKLASCLDAEWTDLASVCP